MYCCNKCGKSFFIPKLGAKYFDGIKRIKTVCPICDSGDIYEYGACLADKSRILDYIFENLPDINAVNSALHSAAANDTATKLDRVLNSLEELICDLTGEVKYPLSLSLCKASDARTVNILANEADSLIRRGAAV